MPREWPKEIAKRQKNMVFACILFIWYIALIDFHLFNQPCILVMD